MGFRTVLTAAVVVGAVIETSQTGARIVMGPSNTLTAYYPDGRVAWTGQASDNSDFSGLFNFTDGSAPLTAAMLLGQLLVSIGDPRSGPVPQFTVGINDTDGSGILQAFNAAGNGGGMVIAPTNATFDNAAIFPQDQVWETPALGSGWAFANIRGALPLRYRIDAEDNLIIKGSVSCTTTTPATAVFPIVAPYLPIGAYALQQDLIMKQSAAGGAFTFGHGFITGGNVEQNGLTFTVGDIISYDVSWPLGNLT